MEMLLFTDLHWCMQSVSVSLNPISRQLCQVPVHLCAKLRGKLLTVRLDTLGFGNDSRAECKWKSSSLQ